MNSVSHLVSDKAGCALKITEKDKIAAYLNCIFLHTIIMKQQKRTKMVMSVHNQRRVVLSFNRGSLLRASCKF
jgi:hypothetical protein